MPSSASKKSRRGRRELQRRARLQPPQGGLRCRDRRRRQRGDHRVFFFNDTPTTEIYTLSLHDALPICTHSANSVMTLAVRVSRRPCPLSVSVDRKSKRLNSSHGSISYAVFCLTTK